jgi:RHS repeat-associated protein
MNQRIVKLVGYPTELDEARHFYYNDRWQCLEERLEGIEDGQPNGAISSYVDCRYLWGARYVDELILRQRDTSSPKDGTLDETLYAMQDANFNVVALAEPDGDVVERFIYDAYGKAKVLDDEFAEKQNGSEFAWEYLYTGRQLDRESGLMYYRNRYYHTGMGRFVNRDPIGFKGSKWNLYEYVYNNPTLFTDPSGFGYSIDITVVDTSDTVTINLPSIPPWRDLESNYPNGSGRTDCIFEGAGAPRDTFPGDPWVPPPGIYKPGITDPVSLRQVACGGSIPANTCDRITLSGHGIANGCGIRAVTPSGGSTDIIGTRNCKKSPQYDPTITCLKSRLKPGGYVRICSCSDPKTPSATSACAQDMADAIGVTVCYCIGGNQPSGAGPFDTYCHCMGEWACTSPGSLLPVAPLMFSPGNTAK